MGRQGGRHNAAPTQSIHIPTLADLPSLGGMVLRTYTPRACPDSQARVSGPHSQCAGPSASLRSALWNKRAGARGAPPRSLFVYSSHACNYCRRDQPARILRIPARRCRRPACADAGASETMPPKKTVPRFPFGSGFREETRRTVLFGGLRSLFSEASRSAPRAEPLASIHDSAGRPVIGSIEEWDSPGWGCPTVSPAASHLSGA